MTFDAVIVGAGIGGLAAGVALRRAGWTVRVLERAANPRELGFALLLAPNATYALRQLGVAERVIAGGHVATGGEMRRPDGTVLRRFSIDRVRTRLPEPTVMVLRPVLHGALLEALGSEALALGCEAVGFSADATGVDVRVAGGASVRGRVLIGADGVRSVVRAQLHPHGPPLRPSGLVGIRGVAHDLPQLAGDDAAQYFGRGIEAGLTKAGGRTAYWYLSIPRVHLEGKPLHAATVARQVATAFHDRFRDVVHAADPADMRLDELADRDPLPSWGEGPVTLLGDAAHPMLPHAGQGAAQAIEDAVALGRIVPAASDPVSGLRAYERIRAARTSAIVALSRRNARMGSRDGRVACWARDVLIRLAPERSILARIVALGRPPDEPA